MRAKKKPKEADVQMAVALIAEDVEMLSNIGDADAIAKALKAWDERGEPGDPDACLLAERWTKMTGCPVRVKDNPHVAQVKLKDRVVLCPLSDELAGFMKAFDANKYPALVKGNDDEQEERR